MTPQTRLHSNLRRQEDKAEFQKSPVRGRPNVATSGGNGLGEFWSQKVKHLPTGSLT